ncbi:MAG: hypothetical protein HY791_40075 [Deltaproteobacteria bacterium]|nr:hypothetical protein [Deltaproteobacteria bacterium]
MRKSGLAVAIIALMLVGWVLLRSQGRPRAPVSADRVASREPGTDPATPVKADAGTARSRPSLLALVEPPSSPSIDAGVDNGASIVEQLAAVHQMGAQADVSEYLQRNAELAAKVVDRFCEDARDVPRPWRPLDESPADAAEFLVGRVDWILSAEQSRLGSQHLSELLMERVGAAGKDWPAALGVGDLADLHFAWLEEARRFDRWSLVTVGPLRETQPWDIFDAPMPNYVQLMAWAKLAFVRAFALGGLAKAADEVRHLGALVESNGILLSEVVAVIILDIERAAFEHARATGMDTTGWTPPAEYDSVAVRNTLKASPNFLFPGVDPAVMKKALACAPSPCSALDEAAAFHTAIGAEAPTDTSNAFFQLAGSVKCDAALLAMLRNATPTAPVKARRNLLGTPSFLEKSYGSAAPP